jgi:hypothetical protein
MAADRAIFRLELAGAGRMGRTHLRAIAGSELVAVAAVAEPHAAARAGLAAAGLPPARPCRRAHKRSEPWAPGFREAAGVQAVCDAMEVSAAQQRWVAVSEVTSQPRDIRLGG